MNPHDYPSELRALIVKPARPIIDWEGAADAFTFVAICLGIAVLAGVA